MIVTKHFAVRWGYDLMTDLPFSFALGILERPNAQPGQLRYLFNFGRAWGWCERRRSWSENGVESAAWTGRQGRWVVCRV